VDGFRHTLSFSDTDDVAGQVMARTRKNQGAGGDVRDELPRPVFGLPAPGTCW